MATACANYANRIDSDAPRADASPPTNMAIPNLILTGYGVTDSLQLTVESQRILARYGSAYSIGLPANLAALLKSQRVKVTDLAGRIAPGRDYALAYLDVAHFLVERTAHERPVIFLTPGNPLMFNTVGRYLAMEGKRLGLTVQVVPAVSPVDVIISGIGLDVATFGLQVFDATRLVARQIQVNPAVPAILMHLGGFGATTAPGPGSAPNLDPLVSYLARCYPETHPATVIHLGLQGMRVANVPLNRLAASSGAIDTDAHLFLDAVRPSPPARGTSA